MWRFGRKRKERQPSDLDKKLERQEHERAFLYRKLLYIETEVLNMRRTRK